MIRRRRGMMMETYQEFLDRISSFEKREWTSRFAYLFE